jgi:hypothetical protein
MKSEEHVTPVTLELPGGAIADSSVEGLVRAHEDRTSPIRGVVVGTLADVGFEGPVVDFPGNEFGGPVLARTVVMLERVQVGNQVVLMFDEGLPGRPIVLGLLEPANTRPSESETGPLHNLDVLVDGDKVSLSAKHEIELRCGKASITLTSSGKVVIRGTHVVSHSSGANRIRGGSVQIN